MQRSGMPERRWISAPFAAPAAYLIRYFAEGFLNLHSVGLAELHPEPQAAGLRGVVTALCFCVVTLGASIVALRRQPDVSVAGEAAG